MKVVVVVKLCKIVYHSSSVPDRYLRVAENLIYKQSSQGQWVIYIENKISNKTIKIGFAINYAMDE